MISDIYIKDVNQLFSTPIVQQTAYWSTIKERLGAVTMALNFNMSGVYLCNNFNDTVVSDVLVILQSIDNNHSIAYIPYGPELEPKEEYQGMFLEELSECLLPFLPKNCIMIRYELCWESYWAKDRENYDKDGHWMGEPALYAQELRFNFNTIHGNFKKAHFNILPSSTIYINLYNDLEGIIEKMKPKTRYNIGLANRKGVTVKTKGLEALNVWYKLFGETARRNNFYLCDINYFKTVLTTKVDNSISPAEVLLLVAELDSIPLAAMFLIISGDRGTFLYGASSSEHRHLMPSYAMQWEAIRICKEKGCIEYDMFGVAPRPDSTHPLYGLYKFKTGFGGSLYHSLGCWDYPLDTEKYSIFKSNELKSQGFYVN